MRLRLRELQRHQGRRRIRGLRDGGNQAVIFRDWGILVLLHRSDVYKRQSWKYPRFTMVSLRLSPSRVRQAAAPRLQLPRTTRMLTRSVHALVPAAHVSATSLTSWAARRSTSSSGARTPLHLYRQHWLRQTLFLRPCSPRPRLAASSCPTISCPDVYKRQRHPHAAYRSVRERLQPGRGPCRALPR